MNFLSLGNQQAVIQYRILHQAQKTELNSDNGIRMHVRDPKLAVYIRLAIAAAF